MLLRYVDEICPNTYSHCINFVQLTCKKDFFDRFWELIPRHHEVIVNILPSFTVTTNDLSYEDLMEWGRYSSEFFTTPNLVLPKNALSPNILTKIIKNVFVLAEQFGSKVTFVAFDPGFGKNFENVKKMEHILMKRSGKKIFYYPHPLHLPLALETGSGNIQEYILNLLNTQVPFLFSRNAEALKQLQRSGISVFGREIRRPSIYLEPALIPFLGRELDEFQVTDQEKASLRILSKITEKSSVEVPTIIFSEHPPALKKWAELFFEDKDMTFYQENIVHVKTVKHLKSALEFLEYNKTPIPSISFTEGVAQFVVPKEYESDLCPLTYEEFANRLNKKTSALFRA